MYSYPSYTWKAWNHGFLTNNQTIILPFKKCCLWLTHASELKSKYFTNTDRTILHLDYTKILMIKGSFVPIFMMNVMTGFSLIFSPFCGRSILSWLSLGGICISFLRLSRVCSSYLDIFSKEDCYCLLNYTVRVTKQITWNHIFNQA